MIQQQDFINSIECNDFEKFESFIKDPMFNPSFDDNYAIEKTVIYDNTDMLKLLLKDERVDPSALNNSAFNWAYDLNNQQICELLWSHKLIKKTLKNDCLEAYNKFIKKRCYKKG